MNEINNVNPSTEEIVDKYVIVNKAIYEHDRNKRHDSRINFIILVVLSVLVCATALMSVGLIQHNEYVSYLNKRVDYLNKTQALCEAVSFKGFDILSTPIAVVLLIIFIILYRRRVFLRNRFKFSRIGLPMIVSCWNKTDRMYTTMVYGRIAYEVLKILFDSFEGQPTYNVTGDPTGLFKLLMRVIKVFVIGIRYYPILVAFRVKSTTVYLLTAIYMWIDFVSTIYEVGVCDKISNQVLVTHRVENVISYWYAYKILNSMPTFFFSSFITLSLTYRGLALLFCHKKFDKNYGCCDLFDIKDDIEIIYSHFDLDYVVELFRNKRSADDDDEIVDDDKSDSKLKTALLTRFLAKKKVGNSQKATDNQTESFDNLDISETTPKSKSTGDSWFKRKATKFLHKHIYHWQTTYRFSMRFVSCHFVAIITLYHFFIMTLYYIYYITVIIIAFLPESFDPSKFKIRIGQYLCALSEDICIEGLEKLQFTLPIPQTVVKFGPEIKPSLQAVLIVPAFGSMLLCTLQFLLSIRDGKQHLLQLYKGHCDYVPRRKLLKNSSIASSSFHYGGYVVGYLIWGYFTLYLFILIIGLLIIFMRLFIGDKIFSKFALKAIPIIVGFIVKKIVNVIASRHVFLHRHTKILALDNFRAFNVFLYFSFFFDCFMGFISSIIRIIKSVIAGIFMMPRISYGFFGRHLERSDNGYATYIGFLHMEAAHTNPILITFCSLLYYKGLSEHARQEAGLDNPKRSKFRGLKRQSTIQQIETPKKVYKKHIVNKWHVMVMLAKNPILVLYRKQYGFKPKVSTRF